MIKMNVWFVSKYASLPQFGAAARLFYLAKEFSHQCNEVVLITSDSNHLCSYPKTNKRYNYDEVDGVKICWIKNIKYKKTASIRRVLSWFDFEFGLFFLKKKNFHKPDVVIISSLSLFSVMYGYYLKLKFGTLLVFEIRDIWPLTLIEEGGVSRFHPFSLLLGFLEKFGYSKADLIVGTMPRLDLHVENVLGYKKDVFCSPLGLDSSQVDTCDKLNFLDKYFPPSKKVIGYAGSMGISNALQCFVDTIKSFVDYEDVHFILVGDGDLKDDFEKQLELYNNVTFVPKIKQCEVQYFLQKCDILYLSTQNSSVWKYGQSMNKLVQYMFSGKPIVASYSGYPTMLNEAGSGIFVPAENQSELKKALLQYTEMSELDRIQVGLRGKKWILNSRIYDVLAKQYIKKIEEVRVSISSLSKNDETLF